MNFILIDTNWKKLLPLTFAKPLSHLLIGIDFIASKWERHLSGTITSLSAEYLQQDYPTKIEHQNILINSAVIPTTELAEAIKRLKENQVLTYRGKFIAAPAGDDGLKGISTKIQNGDQFSFTFFGSEEVHFNADLTLIESPADIFAQNDNILRQDFAEITKNFVTTEFPKNTLAIGDDIFIAKAAKLNHCILNSDTGPIYIGAGAEIMEGCLIRGPFAIGEESTLKMGAKIYGATSIGKHCKVGGEVNNAIINDYSNKGHDGFLGNSVIGSWCNLGADTNTSNLKNNYGNIKVWDYASEKQADTGRQFHGLIMGDHSKAGINTMFNTGTVVGMCANIFDAGFPPKFVPSFSWGNASKGFQDFKIEKAFEAASAMMNRRQLSLSEPEKQAFHFALAHDAKYRGI